MSECCIDRCKHTKISNFYCKYHNELTNKTEPWLDWKNHVKSTLTLILCMKKTENMRDLARTIGEYYYYSRKFSVPCFFYWETQNMFYELGYLKDDEELIWFKSCNGHRHNTLFVYACEVCYRPMSTESEDNCFLVFCVFCNKRKFTRYNFISCDITDIEKITNYTKNADQIKEQFLL